MRYKQGKRGLVGLVDIPSWKPAATDLATAWQDAKRAPPEAKMTLLEVNVSSLEEVYFHLFESGRLKIQIMEAAADNLAAKP